MAAPTNSDRPTDPCILVVTPENEDFAAIGRALAAFDYPLRRVRGIEDAVAVLADLSVAVVISESRTGAGEWRDLLPKIKEASHEPYLIVIAPDAAEPLWQEVLDQGGLDVFCKPLPENLVRTTVDQAVTNWLHLR